MLSRFTENWEQDNLLLKLSDLYAQGTIFSIIKSKKKQTLLAYWNTIFVLTRFCYLCILQGEKKREKKGQKYFHKLISKKRPKICRWDMSF